MKSAFLSRYFGFDQPIDQRTYLRAGLSLMVLKYLVDATAIWLVTGQLWTPLDYLLPLFSLRSTAVRAFPVWLSTALMLWTVPFVWVGVSMTLRRAVDAGKLPWYSLFFFVPGLNYAVMLWLASLPSSATATTRTSGIVTTGVGRLRSALLGIAASLAIGVGSVAIITWVMRSYGLSLFLATPFVLGAITAYIHNHGHPRTARETRGVVLLGLLIVGATLLSFALEGMLCIIMAAPIAIAVALLGGSMGRIMAIESSGPPASAAYALLLIPLATIADRTAAPPIVYEAVTSVVINAPAATVWDHVISFADITDEPSLPFRLGIAYPVRARIAGTGVGAIRRCEFSTGPFVEPITVWDAPSRLSFGVTAQPPALRELSPYRQVYAPHVQGFFKARGGEFRLVSLPHGQTRLEGSTWYSLDLYPQAYWRPIAEWLLTQIHARVLEHVREEAENEAFVGAPARDVDRGLQ